MHCLLYLILACSASTTYPVEYCYAGACHPRGSLIQNDSADLVFAEISGGFEFPGSVEIQAKVSVPQGEVTSCAVVPNVSNKLHAGLKESLSITVNDQGVPIGLSLVFLTSGPAVLEVETVREHVLTGPMERKKVSKKEADKNDQHGQEEQSFIRKYVSC